MDEKQIIEGLLEFLQHSANTIAEHEHCDNDLITLESDTLLMIERTNGFLAELKDS